MEKVSKVKAKRNLKKSVLEAVNLVGGFKKIINPGEVVLLKPNFNTADPPPASSSLDFIKAVTELVYDCGAKIVMVGESSTMSYNTRKIMKKAGLFELENMERPPRIYVFDERKWIKKMIPNSQYLRSVAVTEFLERADKLILLPNLKTHSYAQFTGSLKLSMGLMKPSQRVGWHLRNLQEKIAEFNKLIRPHLIIMDARKCFINKGPAEGATREPGFILASTDRVAIDVEGIKIIQQFPNSSLENIDPLEITQIKKAIEYGIGNV